MSQLYPGSPENPPSNLTSLTTSYKLRSVLAILAIVLFFVLYTLLVVALGFLVYYTIVSPLLFGGIYAILLKIGMVGGAVMLFAFTLKFLFKLKNHKPENRIEVGANDEPQLWEFVYQICEETGAPKPKAIYLDPDVNAYVSYTNTWLSLFLPVKKELTIGLGLVSCLNLSEFKAVISHEFGHFAQQSMKIGSYIMSANTIIHDMIYSRDKWDEVLEQWRSADLRLSVVAWLITPVIWVIRLVLKLFYQFLNVMYSSLSREMEFNADKFAVKTSGSDAIVSALWKLNGGSTNWNNTLNIAYLASKKKVYSENLYLHNNLALARTSKQQKEILNKLPQDQRGGKRFFSGSETSKVNMYASHPPNDKREESAKQPYIPCEEDERSPWLLFDSESKTQESLTKLLYTQYLKKTPENFVSLEAFENFIETERQGDVLLEEYHNTFEHRFFNVPEPNVLHATANEIKTVDKASIEGLKKALPKLHKPIEELTALMIKAQQIAQGTSTEKSLSYQGKEYTKKKIDEGYRLIAAERAKLLEGSFKEWDKLFCATHLHLAKKAGKEDTLLDLYRQHALLTIFYQSVNEANQQIHHDFAFLQSQSEIPMEELRDFEKHVYGLIGDLNEGLDEFDHIDFVPLPNIDDVHELREAIVENGAFKKSVGSLFEENRLGLLMQSLESSIAHCQRIDQKSIGVILALHKQIQEQLD